MGGMKAILPIALVLAALPATAASAAPYRVYGCDGPDDEPLSMHAFSTYELPEGSMNHDDHCRGGDDAAYFEWAGRTAMPSEQAGGWALAAPQGTSLTALRWRGSISGVTGTGVRVEIDTDAGAVGLWSSDLEQDTRSFALPPGTRNVVLRQECRAVMCVTGAGPARTTIRALTATLDDESAPTAAGVAGGLAEPGTKHGTDTLTLAAADAGSGLASAALYVDGATTGARTVALGCTPLEKDAHGFTDARPCPPAAGVELAWATGDVRDGAHAVRAVVADAAGNARTVFGPVTVTTDNAPPAAGRVDVSGVRRVAETLTATAVGFDGQDVAYGYAWQRCAAECEDIEGASRRTYALTAADAGLRVRAVVAATDRGGTTRVASAPGDAIEPAPAATPAPTAAPAPVPAAAPPALVPTGPAAIAPPLARPRVTLSRRTIRSAYGRRIEIRGRVADARGAAIAGATLDVRAVTRVPGARERREGGIGTAADGRFTYVAPAGASRDLRIGGATVTLFVRAAGTLKARRHGRTVALSGRLAGGHVPRGGVLVEIRGAGLTRTDAHGRFALRYRGRRLSFRAVARKDSSWPFVAGAFATSRIPRPGAP